MPTVSVFIRKDDLAKWRAVVNKSEFMHNALDQLSTFDGAKIVLKEDVPKFVERKSTLIHSDMYTNASLPDEPVVVPDAQ